MFSRVSKNEREATMKDICEKKVACEDFIFNFMVERLVTQKNGSLTEEDNRMMKPSVLELYNALLQSPKKIRDYVVANAFAMEKSDFKFENFFELMKMTMFIKLVEEGKIQSE